MAQWQRICLPMQETQVPPLGQEDPWRRKWQPLRYSCPGNPVNRAAWWAAVYGVAEEPSTTEQLKSINSKAEQAHPLRFSNTTPKHAFSKVQAREHKET